MSELREVEVRILDPRIAEPKYATPGSAAFDLRALIDEPLVLKPEESKIIRTGIAIHIGDPGWAALVIPRSGVGAKRGIVLGNLVGLIDPDYQGEIRLTPWNRSSSTKVIEPLERIAQLMIVPVAHPAFRIVEDFSEQTERGEGGFGHTGRQ